jgi:hypothetical protein
MADPTKSAKAQKSPEIPTEEDIFDQIKREVASVKPIYNEIKEILNQLKDIDEKRIRNKKVKELIGKIKHLAESDEFKTFLDFLETFTWCPYVEEALYDHCEGVRVGYIGSEEDEEEFDEYEDDYDDYDDEDEDDDYDDE